MWVVRITFCVFCLLYISLFLNVRFKGKTKDSFDFVKPYVKFTLFGERSSLMLENIKKYNLNHYFSHNNWFK